MALRLKDSKVPKRQDQAYNLKFVCSLVHHLLPYKNRKSYIMEIYFVVLTVFSKLHNTISILIVFAKSYSINNNVSSQYCKAETLVSPSHHDVVPNGR
jgi:hypothetical protein